MSVRYLNLSPAPGWWAVFTDEKGYPLHMPIGAWATVEYVDDEGHEPGCDHEHESFTEIEAALPDSTGLATIHAHSNPIVDYRNLVGLYSPEQHSGVGELGWLELCQARLSWLAEKDKEHHAKQTNPHPTSNSN